MRIGPLNAPKPSNRTGKTTSSAKGAAAGGASAPRDAASVMGVPEAELTPNVQRALLSLMGEVDQMRKETEQLRQRVRELETLADRDALLPVLNRRAFLREVSKALALAERHNAASTLVYLDLNGFKAINDTHGHAAGDLALKHVADLLAAHVRETDAVGRLGGDEFGLVLTLTNAEIGERKVAELVELIETTPFSYEGAELSLGAAWGSIGLEAGGDAESAMAAADAAMYARKQAQRDEQDRKRA